MLTREARAALFGSLVAVLLLLGVATRFAGSGGSAAAGPASLSTHTPRAVWIVRPGQTFALVARRTGLTVARIERLNPGVNPGSLRTGQRIRLRAAHHEPSRRLLK